MTDATATIDGHRVTSCEITMPPRGPWHLDVTTDDAAELAGPVVLSLGGVIWSGTVARGAPWLGSSSWVVVGGAHGWQAELPSFSYRDDAGVKLSTVLADAAREAGETLAPGLVDEVLGSAYAREAGPASRLLAAREWHVRPDGLTVVGPWPGGRVPDGYVVVGYDPAACMVELAVEALEGVEPGRLVAVRDVGDLVLGAVTITLGGTLRVRASARAAGPEPDRLWTSLRGLVLDIVRGELGLVGVYEYRVVTVDGDYLNLQAVSPALRLPDLERVRTFPGVSGASSEPALGSSVLVQFINGKRAGAVVVGYVGADGEGHAPDSLAFASDSVEVGTTLGDVALAGAVGVPVFGRVVCEGDTVQVGVLGSGAITITTQYNPVVGRARS